jgi:hypothetical protein
MELLTLVVSVTSRRVIRSKYITDPADIPVFGLGDVMNGRIVCVSETYDCTEPTIGVTVTGSTLIALTNGASVIYATATGIAVENNNELVFALTVTGSALIAAMGVEFLNAFLEIRATISSQNELIAKEPVTITRAS